MLPVVVRAAYESDRSDIHQQVDSDMRLRHLLVASGLLGAATASLLGAFGRQEGTSVTLSDARAKKWPRSCQGLANFYGIVAGMPWPECTPESARQFWMASRCSGRPTVEKYPGCPGMAPTKSNQAAWMAKWNYYRLGDALKRTHDAPGCKDFPGTVACAYLQATAKISDMAVLFGILSRRRQTDLPGEKDIVVHMRIGDGIQGPDCWHNANDCFSWVETRTGKLLYALPKAYYAAVLPRMPKAAEGYRVVLVGAVGHNTRHAPVGADASGHQNVVKETAWSRAYVRNMVRFFEYTGYKVELREDHDPDTDFVYMSRASTFVQGGGGYSGLIAQMVSLNGKQVLRAYKVCGENKQVCT